MPVKPRTPGNRHNYSTDATLIRGCNDVLNGRAICARTARVWVSIRAGVSACSIGPAGRQETEATTL